MAQSVESIIKKTHAAAVSLRKASDKQIKHLLKALADATEASIPKLIRANQLDVAKKEANDPKTDRLLLNEERIQNIANAIRQVAKLPNPSGKKLEKRKLSNGLELKKVAVPLGVVGAIYESRPNVTFDIAALCLRSMNAVVLKGSADAENTNKAVLQIIHKVLKENDLPPDCVSLLPSERASVKDLFTATKYVDVIIPRGSDSLIQYVRKNSLVPVIETGAGVCHVYVEQHADLQKALDIVVNAKTSRPSVCNAMDTVIVDEAVAAPFLEQLPVYLEPFAVQIFADPAAYRILKGYPKLERAKPEDFATEFLSMRCAVKIVKGMDEALDHIARYSTKHSEAIVSESKAACKRFMEEVDAAAVYSNASTRFTDGEEFGLGAEIGISTQKLHARGPFALEKLVTEKWLVKGSGQIR